MQLSQALKQATHEINNKPKAVVHFKKPEKTDKPFDKFISKSLGPIANYAEYIKLVQQTDKVLTLPLKGESFGLMEDLIPCPNEFKDVLSSFAVFYQTLSVPTKPLYTFFNPFGVYEEEMETIEKVFQSNYLTPLEARRKVSKSEAGRFTQTYGESQHGLYSYFDQSKKNTMMITGRDSSGEPQPYSRAQFLAMTLVMNKTKATEIESDAFITVLYSIEKGQNANNGEYIPLLGKPFFYLPVRYAITNKQTKETKIYLQLIHTTLSEERVRTDMQTMIDYGFYYPMCLKFSSSTEEFNRFKHFGEPIREKIDQCLTLAIEKDQTIDLDPTPIATTLANPIQPDSWTNSLFDSRRPDVAEVADKIANMFGTKEEVKKDNRPVPKYLAQLEKMNLNCPEVVVVSDDLDIGTQSDREEDSEEVKLKQAMEELQKKKSAKKRLHKQTEQEILESDKEAAMAIRRGERETKEQILASAVQVSGPKKESVQSKIPASIVGNKRARK